MSNLDHEKTRNRCNELAARIQADPAFKAQVISDPTGTLTAHQLPAEVIPDFSQEAGMGTEVQADCVVTCYITGAATL